MLNQPSLSDLSETISSHGSKWTRREALKLLSVAGAGSAVFARALSALAAEKTEVTGDMIRQAEWISGLELTTEERKLMLKGVTGAIEKYQKLREVPLDNGVPPALRFDPAPLTSPHTNPGRSTVQITPSASSRRPDSSEDLAFSSLTKLSALVRSRQVTSVELTRLYLERLHRYDPALHCVITYTAELALKQAEQADREIAEGGYRGPLHGIPWGAKDILAVPGYTTTWGAMPYKEQVRPDESTVVARLRQAGAVLVAKLSVGALAMGDVWFGATTKNPWKPEQGSSGSSAGPAAATAAGLVGFAIGTETRGSIISPCTRCGTTGLRPTFGRVSRHGTMALSWSMDKIGPIARSVEDLAVIFHAIHGRDGLDPTAVDRPFGWPSSRDVGTLRVGYVQAAFEEDRTKNVKTKEGKAALMQWQAYDRRTLEVLRELGVKLVPIKLPDRYPVDALSFILSAEAAASFDELTRKGGDDLLVRQNAGAWPNIFRQAQLIPAVEYIRANRIRTLVMQEMEKVISEVDVYVTPSFVGGNLLLTNLTGHPAVVVPNGFRSADGTPTSITFMGKLYGETELLSLAHAYQQATDFHLKRPPLAALSA